MLLVLEIAKVWKRLLLFQKDLNKTLSYLPPDTRERERKMANILFQNDDLEACTSHSP